MVEVLVTDFEIGETYIWINQNKIRSVDKVVSICSGEARFESYDLARDGHKKDDHDSVTSISQYEIAPKLIRILYGLTEEGHGV